MEQQTSYMCWVGALWSRQEQLALNQLIWWLPCTSKACPLVIFAAKPAPKAAPEGVQPHRRQARRPYHAFLNVQAACLQEFCQARHQVPFLCGTEVA